MLEDVTSQLNKRVDLFAELSKNADFCAAQNEKELPYMTNKDRIILRKTSAR